MYQSSHLRPSVPPSQYTPSSQSNPIPSMPSIIPAVFPSIQSSFIHDHNVFRLLHPVKQNKIPIQTPISFHSFANIKILDDI
ncbi:hypothetical protein EYC84_006989 [Monilinia fructicola]|uniref:Uncharacterized protein n=1 Tax=Monilinia fructicola TaxID=38448 RepID=A0A5M9K5P9_MONFR|nr:hypothetical protein EYC84_006989 [Monilinia fructicola]